MTKKLPLILLALAVALTCLASNSLAAKASKTPPTRAAQEKAVKDLVYKASILIKAKGTAAFDIMNANPGKWAQGPIGVFVSDDQGLELVSAADPSLVGRNLWDTKAPDGKLVVQEQIRMVKAKGKGWYDGQWVKPGGDKQVPCRVYVKGVKVKGKLYLVGAAYYLD